ncbi:MAG: CDGSH iron-sulfur domain-containing protein [Nitrospirae bacterium]|nr:CDGSH iron-sulfur domain-containing protein [Nitrospirota bacterium]
MQNKPYIVKESAGTKAYCACHKSRTMPHCDGAHKGTDIRPCVVDIPEAKTVAVCGCGKTRTAPYCDGAHSR